MSVLNATQRIIFIGNTIEHKLVRSWPDHEIFQHSTTCAETARTIVDIVSHGTLATLNEDGTPLGTFISYVLAEDGEPLIRLRHESVHKANLTREPRCSLFVHPSDRPARMLARVTLIGRVRLVLRKDSTNLLLPCKPVTQLETELVITHVSNGAGSRCSGS